MQRKDTTVIEPTEPLINLYYNGPERRSDRNLHEETASKPWRLRSIVRLMLQQTTTPYVFSKNMAYYLAGRMDAKNTYDLLVKGTNTFIIRDPRAALPSHYKQDPKFDWEESGYSKLRGLFHAVTESLGQPPIVIDGDVFCRNPDTMMQKYCNAVGIPFDPESMSWKAGQVPSFDGYGGWTEAAEQSTGFQRPPDELPDLQKYPDSLRRMAERCRRHYEHLLNYAMQPDLAAQTPKNPPGIPRGDTSVTVVSVHGNSAE